MDWGSRVRHGLAKVTALLGRCRAVGIDVPRIGMGLRRVNIGRSVPTSKVPIGVGGTGGRLNAFNVVVLKHGDGGRSGMVVFQGTSTYGGI